MVFEPAADCWQHAIRRAAGTVEAFQPPVLEGCPPVLNAEQIPLLLVHGVLLRADDAALQEDIRLAVMDCGDAPVLDIDARVVEPLHRLGACTGGLTAACPVGTP